MLKLVAWIPLIIIVVRGSERRVADETILYIPAVSYLWILRASQNRQNINNLRQSEDLFAGGYTLLYAVPDERAIVRRTVPEIWVPEF